MVRGDIARRDRARAILPAHRRRRKRDETHFWREVATIGCLVAVCTCDPAFDEFVAGVMQRVKERRPEVSANSQT